MANEHLMLIEGGDKRLPDNPRGYHLELRKDGKPIKSMFSYAVVSENGSYYIHRHVEQKRWYEEKKETLEEALEWSFMRISKLAVMNSNISKLPLRIRLMRDSYEPKNMTLLLECTEKIEFFS